MSKDTGGPAFPKAGLDPWGAAQTVHVGMSLRDYCAAKALGGMASVFHEHWTVARIAEAAYELADAMMTARLK